MKTISLLSAILLLPSASLLAQGQSEIETLRARVDVQDRRISQLENAVIRLGGAPIQKTAPVVKKSTPAKATPVAKKSAPDVGASAMAEYVVVKGDTLTRIASRHQSTVAAIKKENTLKSDGLRIGQKLRIPSSSSASAARVAVEMQVAGKTGTAKAVASKPVEKPAMGSQYKVVAGDTFYGIARRCDMNEAQLQAANPKAVPTRLQIGQILHVSKNAKPAPVKKSATASQKSSRKSSVESSSTVSKSTVKSSSSKTAIRTITVHEQMTYGDFANKHGASTSQLNSLNGLNLSKNTMLAKGSELYVPKQY